MSPSGPEPFRCGLIRLCCDLMFVFKFSLCCAPVVHRSEELGAENTSLRCPCVQCNSAGCVPVLSFNTLLAMLSGKAAFRVMILEKDLFTLAGGMQRTWLSGEG